MTSLLNSDILHTSAVPIRYLSRIALFNVTRS